MTTRSRQPARTQRDGKSDARARNPDANRPAPHDATGRSSMLRSLQRGMGNRRLQSEISAQDGHPLDDSARTTMERGFGTDLNGVRVHADARGAAQARALGADAFTTGSDIFFGSGRYQPQTTAGRELLAHELAHVVQQRHGAPGFGMGRVGDTHEREADAAARGIARGGRATIRARGGVPALQRQASTTDAPATDAPATDTPTADAPANAPNLVPPEPEPETDEERLNRMLRDPAQPGAGQTQPAGGRPARAPQVDLAAAVREMLAACERDTNATAAREQAATAPGTQSPGTTYPKDELKRRIEACLDTPEGQRVQRLAKQVLLSRKGAPITIAAWLASIAATGHAYYIPAIPLGDELELSLGVEGPVTSPEKVMVTLKFSGVPSWLERAGRAVWGATKAVGSAIGGAAAAVGGAIWSGLKWLGRGAATVGRAIGRGAAAVGGAIWSGLKATGRAIATVAGAVWNGITWVAGQLWDKAVGIFQRIARWIVRLPQRVGRLLLGLWEAVKAVRPWSLDWWKSLGDATTWLNLLKWLGARVIDLLEIGGFGEIYETAMDFIKFNTRTLTDAEKDTAHAVFGDSIDLSLIHVDEHAVIGPAFSDREYTSFHTINGWGHIDTDVLMHEMTHVWQYEQAGAIYMPQAIHAQVWGGGYEYGGAAGLRAAQAAGKGYSSFNREQQAQIVQDFFKKTQSDPDVQLYASFVQNVSTLTAAQLVAGRPR